MNENESVAMSLSKGHSAEKDAPWTGCVHCGQTLPHEGTGWRAAYRCRLFQRIAERAWDEGYDMGDPYQRRGNPDEGKHRNPYRITPVSGGRPCSCGIAEVGAQTGHGSEVIAHRAYPDDCGALPPRGSDV